MPRNITPMLAYLENEPFENPSWIFEIKWDGFRAIAEVKNAHVNLYSRNFKSFNQRYPTVVEALKRLKINAVFDGEIVILNKKGISDFQSLQNYQKTGEGDLRYYIFDLLYYKDKDLRGHPLMERKQRLQKLLPTDPKSILQYSKHVVGQGKKFFALAKKKNLEGMIAKDGESPYLSKRSRSWLKIKTHQRQEAIICGFTVPKGSRKYFGALILGLYEKGVLRFAGHVGGGFNQQSLRDVMQQLSPFITTKCPFSILPKTNDKTTWVKPKILCEVSFTEWTKEGQMRHPIFEGLRTDKNPKQVKREVPYVKKRKTR